MKSSPPRLNPKTDLIVSRYLRFPAFFFGCFLPRPARSHRLSVLFLPPRPARLHRLSVLFPLHQTCPFAQTFRLISAAPACPLAQTFRLIPSPCRFLPSDFFDICLDKEFP